jgi:prepilin-type N-terminal cleavage/methylation domain-containing protein
MKTMRERLAPPGDRDRGFGLVEVLVSMMLLALLAVAILPALVGSLKNSAMNATLATATGLVNQQLENARAHAPSTCSSLAASDFTVTDSRGVVLKVARTVPACPASGYPRAISVSVAVTRAATGAAVSSVSTLVFVEGP